MSPQQFFRKARQAQAWYNQGSEVRCENGYCPLGAVQKKLRPTRREKLPNPSRAASAIGISELLAYRIAYASDSATSPDRRWLLKNLGIK